MSRSHSLTHSFIFHFSVVVDLFGRSLQFCHLEFFREAIFVGYRSESGDIGGGFRIFNDFRELSFCCPCGPYFYFLILIPVHIRNDIVRLNKDEKNPTGVVSRRDRLCMVEHTRNKNFKNLKVLEHIRTNCYSIG